MNEMMNPTLPASWLASRLGADPTEIARLRTAGELYASREAKTAKSLGLSEDRLLAILRRRAGLMGGARLLDLLFEGKTDRVVAEVRAAA